MPSQIIFPCPNCGATQSVDETEVSTQCQFCGNTISVPENLRPKAAAPDPAQAASQILSFGGAAGTPAMGGMPGMAGMTGLPSMFMNMDLNKLRAMAMAARAGDTAEAARLYSENFGVSQDVAMQAAELMAAHHHIVLSQMPFGTPQIVQMGGAPQVIPPPRPGMTYNLPSPPVRTRSGSAGRWVTCLAFVFALFLVFAILGFVAFATRVH